jgi:hypothetical protein
LAPGVQYARIDDDQPRPLVIHAVRVDSQADGIGFHVSRPRADWVDGERETDRQTTREFLRSARADGIPMVVAINGDAFAPWPAPYNQSTPTDLRGLAIVDGVLVSQASGTPSLLISHSPASSESNGGGINVNAPPLTLNIATTTKDSDVTNVQLAISGFALCLDAGEPKAIGDDLHPRTGIGLSRDERWLLLVVIDGRQPASHGATVEELGAWLRHFGAWRGINMDGGGSSTLAWWDTSQPAERASRLLNSPVGSGGNFAKLPPTLFFPTERANGKNFGVSLTSEVGQ